MSSSVALSAPGSEGDSTFNQLGIFWKIVCGVQVDPPGEQTLPSWLRPKVTTSVARHT